MTSLSVRRRIGAAAILSLLLPAGAALAQTPVPAPAQAPAASASSDQIDPATTVVATVGGDKVFLAEILGMIEQLPEQYRQVPLEQLFQPLLDRIIDSRLIATAARAAGLADREDVKRRVREAESQIVSETFLTETVEDKISKDALRRRYDDLVKGAGAAGEEVKARHILVATEEEAKALIVEIGKGADFAKLASEKSTGPSGAGGGDLGWFTADQMVKPFSDAAFALEVGKITQTPVQTQFGWHVIKVEDRRAVKPPSFEEVEAELTQEMTREVLQNTVKGLREGAKIERFNLDGSPLKQ